MVDDLDAVGKTADAAKEIAKTTGKGFDLARELGPFLKEVLGELVVDSVGLVGDQIKYYRKTRLVDLKVKYEQALADRGINNLKPVPLKLAIPIIENATIEEDDSLQMLWASLLASAVDQSTGSVHHKFISILKDIDRDDAKLLQFLSRFDIFKTLSTEEGKPNGHRRVPIAEKEFDKNTILKIARCSEDSVRNLIRLGLIKSVPLGLDIFLSDPNARWSFGHEIKAGSSYSDKLGHANTAHVQIYQDTAVFQFTSFGVKFCEQVIDPPLAPAKP